MYIFQTLETRKLGHAQQLIDEHMEFLFRLHALFLCGKFVDLESFRFLYGETRKIVHA